MTCGWLHTGEVLAGAPVRLRVVVLRARPGQADPEPVVHIPGGPGDSAGLNTADLARWRRWQQRAGWPHDIVLYDPRGTGESRPRPDCGEDAMPPRRAPQAPAAENELTDEADRAARCRRRLGDATTAALGPDAQLRDLNALMEGLGVERSNLWAISYGTRLARLFESRHPERVASLVLDSMLPFTQNELLAMPLQMLGAIDQLETLCARPASQCASSAPRRAIATLLDRYETSPAVLRLGSEPWQWRRFRVTPYRLLLMILFAGYDPGHGVNTVQRIERALRGDASALEPLAARLAGQASNPARSEPLFWSTRCALNTAYTDDAAWSNLLAQAPLIAPYIAQARQASVCDRWPVPEVEPPPGGPLSTPTLIVSGHEDRATPPAWGDDYVAAHPTVKRVDVPEAAHVPTLSNACAQRAVAAFLRDTVRAPMLECLQATAAQSGR